MSVDLSGIPIVLPGNTAHRPPHPTRFPTVSGEDRGRDVHCWTPTGWAEAVACLRLPQNVACRFPALRSSGAGSQHYESLQRPVGQPQSWSEQRDPLLEPSEGGPGKVAACPAAATEHLPPVTLDEPVHPLQRADVSGDTIIGVVPAEGEIKRVDLPGSAGVVFAASGRTTTSGCAASVTSRCASQP